MSAAARPDILHATTVTIGAVGVVILGPSGAGKSALALQLIGLGAKLIADDRTRLSHEEGVLTAHAPDRLQGVIEARGVGLIRVPWQGRAYVHLVVDLEQEEPGRLPFPTSRQIMGTEVEVLKRVDGPHFPSAIWHLVTHGRHA
ncbi:HPr kinase/phosphatase C-terminal domain-containing protein [Aliiroseovarius subalbicans]|uniref:HPr kinase/phosphorylase n=1 Tax=Aliiroseovarius subalbicans TaxID=2925840 RepID=UPI001F59D4A0|nr:HPr kinase/phosphatase C-terminal domain-containing protein [Aliiroseovarius subalbicans]MCI2399711.1 HPr kinase/phosphatase C-terminal domain-containing protein [Aliiroseovarius subalbicans]